MLTIPGLASGVFFGWSLGANDAANVWGPAVGSRMVPWLRAAVLCAIFVTAGSVVSGLEGSHTIGAFASVKTIAGAFVIAFSAATTVFVMTRLGLPVSNTHAVAGAIIALSLIDRVSINLSTLYKIVGSWVFSPVLTGIFAVLIYSVLQRTTNRRPIHLLTYDARIRTALVAAGIVGSYTLGANNIGNVIGVFQPLGIFSDIELWGWFRFSGERQLALMGGSAIALGVLTYSKRVIMTVGQDIYRLSPLGSFSVIIASSLVLFMFASKNLQSLLLSAGLPALPLVPVSSSQSIVGGVVGLGLVQNRYNVNYRVLGRIGVAWVATPLASGLLVTLLALAMRLLEVPTA